MATGYNIPGFGHVVPATTSGDIYAPGADLVTMPLGTVDTCSIKVANVPSPAFITEIAGQKISPLRQLWINSVDFSDRVMKWPSFRRDIGQVKPVSLTIPLSNADKTLNYFINSYGMFSTPAVITYGINDPACGDEYMTLFRGTIETVDQKNSVLNVGLMDKFKSFGEIKLGTSETPLSYVSSNYFPGDLVWEVITVEGGLDSTLSAANIDIDYDSWVAWKTLFEDDNIRTTGEFSGAKLIDVMQEMADLYDSVMTLERSRLTFSRRDFTQPDSVILLVDGDVKSTSVEFDDKRIVNEHFTKGDFNTVAGLYETTGEAVNAGSQTRNGLRTETLEPDGVWLVGQVANDNLSDRIVARELNTRAEYEIISTLKPAHIQLNSGVRFTDAQLDVTSASIHRVSGLTHNVDNGETKVRLRVSDSLVGFRLDHDTNSGSLGLLDHNHNVLL